MDVIVVGGGIVGTSAAFHLAKKGVSTALVDASHLGQATAAGTQASSTLVGAILGLAIAVAIATYLEMRSKPSLPVVRPHRSGMLLRLSPPTVGFYRYLYTTVGEQWGWSERSAMDDEDLFKIISDPHVDVFVLFMGGVPAGFFELDRRRPGEVELVHFGLAPEFIGRGLGKHLLASAIETAWDHEPERVWVRSTNLEHPRGLLIYQWAGFVPYDTKRETVEA